MRAPISMNKSDYLRRDVVKNFVGYLARLLDGAAFEHSFIIRDRKLPPNYKKRFLMDGLLTIRSLAEAFDRYWWNREDFSQNKAGLDAVASIIRQAIASEGEEESIAVAKSLHSVHKVLEWGAGGTELSLYTANYGWATKLGPKLLGRLKAGRTEMASDNPRVEAFSRPDGPRMNAGFTKYYSLACGDNVVIYDGRVGAALGLLVREFCISINCQKVPPELRFHWGPQNPGKRGAAFALNRNPSTGPYVFPKLPARGGSTWATANILANWVLGAAIAQTKATWCKGQDGLRRVEAALFTIGYKIPRLDSSALKTKAVKTPSRREPKTALTKVAHLLGPKATAFRYEGTFHGDFSIDFGSGVPLNVPNRLLVALRDNFRSRVVSLGADRTNTPEGSIGYWLAMHSREYGLAMSSQHAARLTAVLKNEGILEVVTRDAEDRKSARGRRPITVRFIDVD